MFVHNFGDDVIISTAKRSKIWRIRAEELRAQNILAKMELTNTKLKNFEAQNNRQNALGIIDTMVKWRMTFQDGADLE